MADSGEDAESELLSRYILTSILSFEFTPRSDIAAVWGENMTLDQFYDTWSGPELMVRYFRLMPFSMPGSSVVWSLAITAENNALRALMNYAWDRTRRRRIKAKHRQHQQVFRRLVKAPG